MKRKLNSCLLILGSAMMLQACVPAAIIGGTAVTGKIINDPRSLKTQLSDDVLEHRVMVALNKDPQLKKEARIDAISYNHDILLVGQVPSEELKVQAGNITRGVQYVRAIYNELLVNQPISASQVLTDVRITSQIKSKLFVTPNINSINVKVITENGNVYLMGNVLPGQAKIIVNIARQVEGVKQVFNAMHLVSN
ncbi:hypothetical protein A6A19_02165 [Actinobacillus delphinicola]|uniref:21 kDa hemolysin n=1 Tax=Actinobacillus delphinicola TaxID=51161 RepID=A0A448TS34_9PAST|nr:division/outer membrane stress-associated lipid-binding lipoprotein [Actinobacillus delphinicola]MDG6896833.1 hypothetical protein [Actinobacillus delphinicola]VEJ08641.1 21 kDa hemolysin [Actinobacillus delphinicola]